MDRVRNMVEIGTGTTPFTDELLRDEQLILLDMLLSKSSRSYGKCQEHLTAYAGFVTAESTPHVGYIVEVSFVVPTPEVPMLFAEYTDVYFMEVDKDGKFHKLVCLRKHSKLLNVVIKSLSVLHDMIAVYGPIEFNDYGVYHTAKHKEDVYRSLYTNNGRTKFTEPTPFKSQFIKESPKSIDHYDSVHSLDAIEIFTQAKIPAMDDPDWGILCDEDDVVASIITNILTYRGYNVAVIKKKGVSNVFVDGTLIFQSC